MRRAFTLLEVVLAMSVAAVVMFGCAATLLNLANTAERVEGGWSLTKHADGAEKFLRAAFINSALLHASKIGNVSHQNASNTLAVAEIPESSETALAFEIDEQTPILLAAERFSPEKICYLSHDTDGLSLVWRHANAEKKNSEAVLYKTPLSKTAQIRLQVLRDSNDGFVIAQKDLEIRGPGELLGTRQTGNAEFKVADLLRDQAMIPEVQRLARHIHERYPQQAKALIERWMPETERYSNA